MIIEQGSVRCFIGLNEAQITLITKDKQAVNKLIEDSEKHALIADFKPLRAKRSLDANAYMWVLCDKIADVINNDKETVYRDAIKHVGVFKDIAIVEDGAESFIDLWTEKGTGYFTETFDSKLDGCKRIRLYYGSHKYDSKEMSRLIDYIVQEAKDLNIETLPPTELERLRGACDDI